ncbi:MAG: DHA2 family efflux MFS transporter permease subunit [Candidatus Binataceae bacterium]
MAELNSTSFEPEFASGKWLVAISVMLGTFLSVMDVTVVNVAMPHMMGAFGVNLLSITWVSTAYSIAEIIMITMSAWLASVFGRRRLFLSSMALFITGSVIAGTSRTFNQMLFNRVVQGIGGGSLVPVSQAILRETFPPAEQGMAMAVYSMGVVLAPAIGPVLGGWLVDHYGWRWVFYINVPICLAGLVMVSTFVHDPPYLKRGVRHIDWTGIALLLVGLATAQIILERGQQVDWFSSDWIVFGLVIAAVALISLIVRELRVDEPVINFRLLRNAELRAGTGIAAMLSLVLFGSSFLLPQLTENLLDYPAYQAGMVLIPRAIVMLAVMPIVGRLYNLVSPQLSVLAGLLTLSLSYWWLSHFSLGVSFWSFLPVLVLSGLGMSFAMVTLSTVTLSTIERENMTSASSLYTLIRREAGNVAYALFATVLARSTQYHRAILVPDISRLNPIFRETRSSMSSYLAFHSLNSLPFSRQPLDLLNRIVNRQATMMAYNDVFSLVVPILLLIVPVVFLLPKRGYQGRQHTTLD